MRPEESDDAGMWFWFALGALAAGLAGLYAFGRRLATVAGDVVGGAEVGEGVVVARLHVVDGVGAGEAAEVAGRAVGGEDQGSGSEPGAGETGASVGVLPAGDDDLLLCEQCGVLDDVEAISTDPEDPWWLCLECRAVLARRLGKADTGRLYALDELMVLLRKAENPRRI